MNPKVSVAGGVLTIVGGIFILLVGAVVAYILGSLLSGFSFGGKNALTSLLFLGPVVGLVIIVVGVLAMVAPDLKILWGVLVILLSIVSLFTTALGGFALGFILALIGGILILVKKAPPPAPMMATPMGAPPPPSGM